MELPDGGQEQVGPVRFGTGTLSIALTISPSTA